MRSPLPACKSSSLRRRRPAPPPGLLAALALFLLASPAWAGLISWDSSRSVYATASMTITSGGLLCGYPFNPPCTTETVTDGPYEQTSSGSGPWSGFVMASVSNSSIVNPRTAYGSASQSSDLSVAGDQLSASAGGYVGASGGNASSDFSLAFEIDKAYSFSLVAEGDASLEAWSSTDYYIPWTATSLGYQAVGTFAPGLHNVNFSASPRYPNTWSQSYLFTADFAPAPPDPPAVPEPPTLLLLSAGLLSLAILSRRN